MKSLPHGLLLGLVFVCLIVHGPVNGESAVSYFCAIKIYFNTNLIGKIEGLAFNFFFFPKNNLTDLKFCVCT